jgi:transcriptional regulator with XRE-family HTH domain
MTADEREDFETFYSDLAASNASLQDEHLIQAETAAFEARLRQRMRAARGRRKQAEVAERMGLRHQSRVSRLESADSDLSVALLYRYARAVGCVPLITLVPVGSMAHAAQDAAPNAAPVQFGHPLAQAAVTGDGNDLTSEGRAQRHVDEAFERSLEAIGQNLVALTGQLCRAAGPDD